MICSCGPGRGRLRLGPRRCRRAALPIMAQSAPAADRLGDDRPTYLMPPSPIAGTPAFMADLGGFEDGRQLRHAHARHHAGGADRAGPDADLDGVGAGIDQRAGALSRGHVARHHLARSWTELLHPRHRLASTPRGMAVRGIDHDRRRPRHRSRASARGCRPSSPTPVAAAARRRPYLVLAGAGELGLGLLDVLHRDQADAAIVGVDHQQLLDAVAGAAGRCASARAHALGGDGR